MVMKNILFIFAFGLIVACAGTAAAGSIALTSNALGLGTTDINYAGDGSYVEADRSGKLVTSTLPNVGSVLTIQTDGKAGPGSTANPLLVTVTARSHLDVQNNLPAGYDVHGGIITLSNGPGIQDEGLGVRAFTIDTRSTSDNYGKRYNDGTGKGFRMEGSKEVSGGVDTTDWNVFIKSNPVPKNSPPHVDEDVTFDFNYTQVPVAANSIVVLLTKITAGSKNNPFDLSVNLTINLVGGTTIVRSYDYLSNDKGVFSLFPGYTDVIQASFSGASLGISPSDIIDSFTIGAKDDPADGPAGTDEHFLINGFYYSITTTTTTIMPTTTTVQPTTTTVQPTTTTAVITTTTSVLPTTTTTVQPTTTTSVITTTTTEPPTLIELLSFTATEFNKAVILKWQTASEIDNAGFNIYRSDSVNGEYSKINTSLIQAQGSSTQGASYKYTDSAVQNRKTYYYKLEDVDCNGNSTMHGPVDATPRWIYGMVK
jgi:hypothetical protein